MYVHMQIYNNPFMYSYNCIHIYLNKLEIIIIDNNQAVQLTLKQIVSCWHYNVTSSRVKQFCYMSQSVCLVHCM